MREQHSVAAYLVKAALHGIEDTPARVAAVLAQAGIDSALLAKANARLSAESVRLFWLAMDQELNDEFFGFDSRGLPSGSFALICRALIQEPTLGKALTRCLSYLGLFIQDISARLEIRGTQARILLETRMPKGLRGHAAEEIYLSIVLCLMCWLVGRRLSLNRSEFRHAPLKGEEIPWHWGPWVEFNASHTLVEFDASYLQLPVQQTPTTLKAFLRHCPQWLVVRFRNEQGTAAQVFARLKRIPIAEWPTLKTLAKDLGLREASLRHQLAKEGFSYQEIKHQVRRAQIFSLLADPALSISDIAHLAGFQEPSALHRLFRRWTGQSPGQFRARLALSKGLSAGA